MWFLGVPLALPLAVLAFLTGYIPYFGGIVVTAIILLVSLAALGAGPTLVLLLLLIRPRRAPGVRRAAGRLRTDREHPPGRSS